MINRRSRPCVRDKSASIDRAFDRLIPDDLRHLSPTHWSPVQVAIRAATLLCPTRSSQILDVGAGVGKVCAIGALSTWGVWHGVEQHAPLVETATRLARTLGVSNRTSFVRADAFTLDWTAYDALYFYNPFELALFGDSHTDRSKSSQIARVQQRLADLPNCTRVVTFHGFGGVMPPTFDLVFHQQMVDSGLDLALWIQRRKRRAVSVPS